MFVVFDKSKINAYLISVGTVACLFVMAFFITNEDSVQTGANQIENNVINNAQSTVTMV